jgi:hypothetical protein
MSFALSGLQEVLAPLYRGLTPPAKRFRPFGANNEITLKYIYGEYLFLRKGKEK